MIGNSRSSDEEGLRHSQLSLVTAYYLIFSSLLILKLRQYKWQSDKALHLLNIFGVVALAMSSIGLVMMMTIFMIYFLSVFLTLKPSKRSLVIILLSSVLGVLTVIFLYWLISPVFLENSRIMFLISNSLEKNIFLLFRADASINYRLEHLVFSFHGAFNNYFLPGGIDTFADIRSELSEYYNGYFWWGRPAINIQCWLGDWAYILGAFGILALFMIYIESSDGSREDRFFLLSVTVLLLTAIPPAFPLVPMIFATFMYNKKIFKRSY